MLPWIIQTFRERYPDVQFHLHQGTSEQIAAMADVDRIDFAIATGSRRRSPSMRCYPVIAGIAGLLCPRAPAGAATPQPSIEDLAAYPIVTYVFSFTGPSSLHDAFTKEGLTANVALTARDADVIKAYVRLGLGVGIIANVALHPTEDRDLVSISAAHLFPANRT